MTTVGKIEGSDKPGERRYHSFKSFLLAVLWVLPVSGFVIFYCLLHVGLRVPLDALVPPFVIYSSLTFLLAAGLFWSLKNAAIRGEEQWRLCLVLCGYMLVNLLLLVHYGVKLGYVSAEEAAFDYVGLCIFIAACGIGGFYLYRALHKS